jgi:RNA polymerase sigma factor for flagellar operon FliA
MTDDDLSKPSDADGASDANELIAEGQGLVRSLALGIHRSLPIPMDLDDLIAYGQLGLAEAAQAFDAGAGVRFTTFAYYRVRGAIYDGVSKMTWTSRARLRRFRFQQMADDVLASEQAESRENPEGNCDDADWLGRITERLAVVFLATSSNDSVSQSMSEAIDQSPSPGRVIANRELQQSLRKVVGDLPRDACRLINLIYFEGFTLTQAADRIGISKSWASRLHAKSLDQMAKTLKNPDD